MRYDPKRRARVMAWLTEQGVDITAIPQLAKPTPTPQASEGTNQLSATCLFTIFISHHEEFCYAIMRLLPLHDGS